MEAELRQYSFVAGLIFVTFGIQLAFLWTSHPGTVEKIKKIHKHGASNTK